MKKQLDLFEEMTFDYGKGEFKEEEPEKQENTIEFDRIMSGLDELNRMADAQNSLLRAMIDDIQKDWTEEEKSQINDPKEYQRQQKLKEQEKPKEPVMAKELTAEAIEALKNSKVEGLVVKLPEGQLDRTIYVEVKNRLELIGGKWKGGKVSGFVFQEDPTELLEQISSGEKRNLKKEFQFFGTPGALADRLVSLAEIKEGDSILEPSAGQGAIIKAIHRVIPEINVQCCELMELNQAFLKRLPNTELIASDFLDAAMEIQESCYTKIIANPPFSKNQDINHITKMYSCLADGGRLVSIASKHWQMSSNNKETQFREWLNKVGAEVIEIEAGEFKESGTGIATVIIVINK